MVGKLLENGGKTFRKKETMLVVLANNSTGRIVKALSFKDLIKTTVKMKKHDKKREHIISGLL